MSYRNVFISTPAKVSVRMEQLVIDGERKASIPIEDIDALVLENQQILVTAAALARLSENGTAVYFCDQKHLPCSVLLGFSQHSRQLKTAKCQLEQTKPRLKHLWQQIVSQKIQNQARCLEFNHKSGAETLKRYAGQVNSGDTTNVEGTAAALYFRELFGNAFRRDEENTLNAALNYGYAILRGAIARSISAYGFLPAFGIHHCSELNQYNLADDVIEPFRPVVDLFVAGNISNDETLDTNIKAQLVHLLNANIISGEENHSVAYAIERTVQSLGRCYSDSTAQLLLPKLCELRQHEYE